MGYLRHMMGRDAEGQPFIHLVRVWAGQSKLYVLARTKFSCAENHKLPSSLYEKKKKRAVRN